MRYLISFFIAVLCYSSSIAKDDYIILSGQISNKTTDTLKISYNINTLAYYPTNSNAVLNKEGKFKIKLPVKNVQFQQIDIRYGSYAIELFLSSGDSLYITANGKKIDSSLRFAGSGANIQQFLQYYTLKYGPVSRYSVRIRTAINYGQEAFYNNIIKEYNTSVNEAEQFFPRLPSHFINYWKNYHYYFNQFFIQQYPQSHHIITIKRYTDTIPDTSYAVYKYLDQRFNDSFVAMPPYLLYLTGITEAKMKENGYKPYRKDTMGSRLFVDSMYKLAATTMPDKSLEYFMAQNIYSRAQTQENALTHAMMENFKLKWPGSNYTATLEKQIEIAERHAPGKMAPNITFYDETGKAIPLDSLKGKVVYLNFWASWCRQCVGDMMSEDKIKILLSKKPVVFAYLAIDGDTVKQKQLIERYKIKGIFAHTPLGWNAPEIAAYGVQSLPAYFIIDKEGKFVMQSAIPPSESTALILKLESVIDEKK